MSFLFKIIMFISSFFPLWLSILILELFNFNIASIKTLNNSPLEIRCTIYAMIILIIISLFLIVIIKINARKENTDYTLKNITKEKSITTEYLLANMLPLICFNFSEISNLILFGLYMFFLSFLCIKNDNVYTNIMLELLGYSRYFCEVSYTNSLKEEVTKNILIISRSNLMQVNKQNYNIEIFELNNTIGIYSKEKL